MNKKDFDELDLINTDSKKENLSRQEMMRNNSKIKKKNSFFAIKNKKMLLILFLVIVIILIIIFVSIFFSNNFKFKRYEKFEEKMNIYGLNKLYNNENAKTNENVTKSEAIKVIIGTVLNKYDILDMAEDKDFYQNATWCEFAEYNKIIDIDITEKNEKENIKYVDLIRYFNNVSKFFKKNLKELKDIKVKDIDKYSVESQIAIKNFVNNEIIELYDGKINGNQVVFKGLLNEICVNYAEKFNTIVLNENDKININKEKEPSNSNDFPFTLSNVDKSEYEKPFKIEADAEKMMPKDMYKYQKEYMPQMAGYSESFFNKILNIDYEKINEKVFEETINDYLMKKVDSKKVKEYVKYVKDNKIKIEGKAKHISPVIYYDGFYFRVRLKLEFKILNSNTDLNLLFLDKIDPLNNKDKKYLDKNYTLYVDYEMETAINSDMRYIRLKDLYTHILENKSCRIELVGDK